MSRKVIELYEIEVKMSIRKDFWDGENDTISADIIHDKIQQGIEIPIESIKVVVK